MSDDSVVVGIDINETVVNRNNSQLSRVIQADSTDIASMEELGIADSTR